MVTKSHAPLAIVLIDDHLLYRNTLTQALEPFRHELVIRGAGGSAEDAERLVCAHSPDVLVLDLNVPRRSRMLGEKSPRYGMQAIRAAHRHAPATRLLIVSHYATDARDLGLLYLVYQAGIHGYLAKRDERRHTADR